MSGWDGEFRSIFLGCQWRVCSESPFDLNQLRNVACADSVCEGSGMTAWESPKTVNLVDLGFMDSRSKLIDLAAFLDRTQKAGQDTDFRVQALKKAIGILSSDEPARAREVLMSLSDPSLEPIEKATVQGAIGAFKASL